jgi:hypothetical protein
VAAAGTLPAKRRRPLAEAGAVGARRLRQDRPQLAFERDALRAARDFKRRIASSSIFRITT